MPTQTAKLNLIGETQACGSDAPRRATPPWRRDRPFSRVLDTPHGALDTPVAVAHSVYTLWQQRWRFERGEWRLAKARVLLARFERGLIRRRAEQAADEYPLINHRAILARSSYTESKHVNVTV